MKGIEATTTMGRRGRDVVTELEEDTWSAIAVPPRLLMPRRGPFGTADFADILGDQLQQEHPLGSIVGSATRSMHS